MSFFNSLYNSLYNFKWLRQQKDSTRWAWGYFFLLTFLVAGLIVIPTAFKYFSEAPAWKTKMIQEVPEFQATIKNGQLNVTGLSQPYTKKYDQLVIAVDTVSTGTLSVKQFVSGDKEVGILATKDRLEFYNPQDQSVKVQNFTSVGEFVTDRAHVLSNVDKILSRQMLSLFTLAFALIILLYLVIGNLISVFFFSLVFYQWSKKRNLDYSFKQVFTIGLFAITLPLILEQLVVGVPFISLVWSALFGVLMYWALFKSEK